jgi:hypothetical protein
MTHQTLYVILQPYHPTNGSSAMKIKLLVTNAMSYGVLIGGVVLYPTVSHYIFGSTLHLTCCDGN